MSAEPIAVVATGLVTGVGLDAPSSCAAIRCAVDGFAETRFVDSRGEWIVGCEVPLPEPWRGRAKLLHMLASAVRECLAQDDVAEPERIPCLLCLAEPDRPGRIPEDEDPFFAEFHHLLGHRLHPASHVVPEGRVGFVTALSGARRLLRQKDVARVLIAATDGFLFGATLAAYESANRLLMPRNSDGFIPGEAASAILVGTVDSPLNGILTIAGLGTAVESASIDSGLPLRAGGLASAIKAALADAGCRMADLDYRITDVAGEQYQFKEASLAVSRVLRTLKQEFDIWHPADCVGETGAAAGGIMTAVVDAACRKGYSKGCRVLHHLGNDDGRRAAVILRYEPSRA